MKNIFRLLIVLLPISINANAVDLISDIKDIVKENAASTVTKSNSAGNPSTSTSGTGDLLEFEQQKWQSVGVRNGAQKVTWTGTASMVYVNNKLFRAATQTINLGRCTVSMTANSVTGKSNCKVTSLMVLK